MYTTLDKVSVVFFGLINFIILARVFSKSEFGVWVLFTGIMSILETLREGFVKNSFIAHFASCEAKERDKIGSSAFTLNVLYSVIVSLLLLVVAVPLENFWSATQLAMLIKIYAITNIVFAFFAHFEYVQQSAVEFKGIFYSHLIRSVVPTLYILIFFILKKNIGLVELAWVSLSATVIATAVCILFAKELRHKFVLADKNVLRQIFRFGRYTFGSNVSALAIRNTDSWMLGRMISLDAVAAYNPAVRVANMVEIPTLTAANLVFPRLAGQHNKDNAGYVRWLYERSLGFVMAVMLPALVVMFFFSDWIIVQLAGQKYSEYGYLLKITAFYCLFIPFARQFGILLEAMRKPEINFAFVLGTAVINIVLNYFFILHVGIAGAAYATLTTYVIRFILQQLLLFKLFNIWTSRVFKYAYNFYTEGYSMLKTFVARYG